MTLTFVTNLVHHHQLPVADEFYKYLGMDYHYIATEEMPDWLVKGGYDPNLDRPYIIRSYRSTREMVEARRLIDESDVVISGSAPVSWTLERKKADKVTFYYSERWLKKIDIHCISPNALYSIYKNYFRFRNKRVYMLCSSAFTKQDVTVYGCFPSRCYKWGYFTKVDQGLDLNTVKDESTPQLVRIMWCSRFLDWKHPELPVKLAEKLKKSGYKVVIDMYGSGEEFNRTNHLAESLGVTDMVKFCGNKRNEQILEEMKNHEIFLFTSDRNEGWGAVLNESMSNGCAVVVSHMIGAAPFLVKDGENGLIFKSQNLDSLYFQVKQLLDDDRLRKRLSHNAIQTMQNLWSPAVAAKRFLHLADNILNGQDTDFIEGPCSKA